MHSIGHLGMQLRIGDGNVEDKKRFMQCAYVDDASGTQVVGDSIYGKTLILGFPEGDENAAWIPPPEQEFTDPVAFRAEVDGKTLVYEHFAFGVEEGGELYTDPSYFTRQLAMFLGTPSWFNAGDAIAQVNCTMHSSFGDHTAMCRDFSAIAVNFGESQAGDEGLTGTKLDLNGWSPAHYWMPGYFNEIKDTKLVLRTDGKYSVPKQLCFGTANWKSGCTSEAGDRRPDVQALTGSVATAFQAPGDSVSYLRPNSSSVAFVQLRSYECLNLAELQNKGYVKPGMSEEAAKFPEPHKKFCVVKGHFIENDNKTFDENTKTFEELLNVKKSASLFWSGEPRRLNARGTPRKFESVRDGVDVGFDVTDFIYAGARPGHNAEDTMKPFNQLGAAYEKLPSDPSYFAPMPDLYNTVYKHR